MRQMHPHCPSVLSNMWLILWGTSLATGGLLGAVSKNLPCSLKAVEFESCLSVSIWIKSWKLKQSGGTGTYLSHNYFLIHMESVCLLFISHCSYLKEANSKHRCPLGAKSLDDPLSVLTFASCWSKFFLETAELWRTAQHCLWKSCRMVVVLSQCDKCWNSPL